MVAKRLVIPLIQLGMLFSAPSVMTLMIRIMGGHYIQHWALVVSATISLFCFCIAVAIVAGNATFDYFHPTEKPKRKREEID